MEPSLTHENFTTGRCLTREPRAVVTPGAHLAPSTLNIVTQLEKKTKFEYFLKIVQIICNVLLVYRETVISTYHQYVVDKK